ncbi:flagellar biosynthesis protein [Paraburkholderia azotifigens]|uniref:Flagellar biosynthesis protein n=1 Tax=Paraburkholderia azotifigens TaxID=2057004 RepID=A0A5C6V3F9_9BURK|nr:flagellar biosynthesis protein [Paraburkholderia azotifigens]TXC79649.1 flagellar biosynthesis protein [Paraburkholderia azotifigens]
MLFGRLAIYGLAASILAGCAVGRTTVDVSALQGMNPATGKYVRIDSAQDKRTFTVAPPSADMASLDPAEDSSDASKARAIGRKRNGYGKALGDVVLPEGKTVSGLVESALTTGFQQAGYVVVKQGDPNFDSAAPVTAQIVDFWAWFQPGFWSVTTNQKSEVKLSGDVGALHGAQTLKTRVSESKQVVTSSDWQEIVEKGLAAIAQQTKDLINGK